MSTRPPAEAWAQAQRCWSGSVAVHQQALLGSARLLGGEDAAVGSRELLPHSCHGAPPPLAWRLWDETLSHGRFLHKNPEDPSEVPGGFLSDLNPVSSSRTWGYGPGGSWGPPAPMPEAPTSMRPLPFPGQGPAVSPAGRGAGGSGAVEGAEGPGVPAELPPPARTPCTWSATPWSTAPSSPPGPSTSSSLSVWATSPWIPTARRGR